MKGNIWNWHNSGLSTVHRTNLVGFVGAFICLEMLCYRFTFRRSAIALCLEVGPVTSFPAPTAFTERFLPWTVEGFAHFELHLCFPEG